jgi:DNA helicase-2/ATP-dependent DNA helicase PcrA
LIQEGVSPDDILSLTFTATAAKNLRDRVEQQVGKLSINRTGAGAVTFHSLALSFAQEQRDDFGFELAEFPLATENVANKLSGEAARRYDADPRSLRSNVSVWKRSRVCSAAAIRDCENRVDAKQLKLALAYKEYDKKCKESGVLDFDSLIYQMVEILDKKPGVRSKWIRSWVQVDEAQDLSKIEWDLVRLISGPSVLAVGDTSQGIYGFRGSDGKLFSEMEKMFPGTQTLYLATNYRSTPEVINFIRPFAASKELAEKFHTPNPAGVPPEIRGFVSPSAEAAWIVGKIKESI